MIHFISIIIYYTIMLEIVALVFITVVTGIVGMYNLPLYKFVAEVEEPSVCGGCEYRTSCFAQKTIMKDGNMLDEFMLLSYRGVKDYCGHVLSVGFSKKIIFFVCNAILVCFLYWSRDDMFTGVVFSVSASMLFDLSIVDWNTQYIPVEYTAVIMVCGLIRLFADVSNWWEYVIGLIAVSGFLYIVNIIATPVLKKRYGDIDGVIGGGDIKLMAAAGLLLGWKLNFIALGLGCIIGSIIHLMLMKIKGSDRQFALGPYLSLGVYITMICGEQLVSWYLNMIGISPY